MLEKVTLKKYSIATYLKFILLSAFGIFAFFINFPLPSYQLHIGAWQFGEVAGQSNVLVSHCTNFLKAALWSGNFKAMPVVVWLIGVYSMIDLFVLRRINSGAPLKWPPPLPRLRF